MLPYAAYLRAYEPLSAFSEPERSRWAAYAAAPQHRVSTLEAEHADAIRRLIAVPPIVAPARESGEAYVRRADGVVFICPWQTRLRSWLALGRLRNSLPPALADTFVPRVCSALAEHGVELLGDERARALWSAMGIATDDDFAREFLALRMTVAVAGSLDEAIGHVNRFGSGHTEAIVTGDLDAARRFTGTVDAAVVIVNASTRFTDGERFGFGAEIGISTQKLHARGPMGLRELTTYKYVLWGDGQVVE